MSIRISVRMLGNCTPVIVQRCEQLPVAPGSDSRSNHHHQVPASQHVLVLTETFPYQPLYAVALHRATGVPDRYRRAQACMTRRTRYRQYRHIAVGSLALALPEDPLVLGRGQQPGRAGVTRGSTR